MRSLAVCSPVTQTSQFVLRLLWLQTKKKICKFNILKQHLAHTCIPVTQPHSWSNLCQPVVSLYSERWLPFIKCTNFCMARWSSWLTPNRSRSPDLTLSSSIDCDSWEPLTLALWFHYPKHRARNQHFKTNRTWTTFCDFFIYVEETGYIQVVLTIKMSGCQEELLAQSYKEISQ